MKKTFSFTFIIIFISASIISTSCHTSTMYSENMNVQTFQYELHPTVTKNKIIQITPEDIQKYFLSNDDRTTWILFFYHNCMKTVSNEVSLYKKFSDQLDLVIISLTYKIQEIKYEEFYVNYPIYFISVDSDNMRMNQRNFGKNTFGKNTPREARSSSNVFIYKNRITNTCYSQDINEDYLRNIITNNSTSH